jgi:hypothetical protein
MSKKLIITVLSLLIGGCAILALVFWISSPPDILRPQEEQTGGGLSRIAEVPQPPAAPAPMAAGVRVRVAIGGLGFADDEQDGRVSDLTLAELNGAAGLEMVDRQSLDAVLKELSLSLSGLVRAKDAVRAGKLLRADWFLLGTRAKIAGTNSIVIRLVEADSGILRDAGVIPADGSQSELAAKIAEFVRQSRQEAAAPKPRIYLAIGAFEDLSLNNRQADFTAQLRGYLTAAYRNSGVTVLEREYVEVLLQEMELDLAGLTDEGGASPRPMQSSYWLAEGCYQSYQTGDNEIEITLDVRRIFGRTQRITVRSAAGEPADEQIKLTIDAAMKQNSQAIFPTRVSEARAELQMGRDIAQLGIDGLTRWFDYRFPDEDPRDLRNTKEAIRAFETALLLDPTNREAKMYLAACLREPSIGQVERARNYYRAILEEPVNDMWVRPAQEALDNTFAQTSPEEKTRWFESAGSQATNSPANEYYQREAAAARLKTTLKRGGADAQELAEQHLLAAATNIIEEHDMVGNVWRRGIEEFERSFGTNRAAAARRLTELYPKLKAQAPNFAVWIMADVVTAQVDTNEPMVSELQGLLDEYAEHPEKAYRPELFWRSVPYSVYPWSYEHKLYHMAARVMEGETRAAALYPEVRGIGSDDQMRLAAAYLQLEEWQKALEIFQSYSNAPVQMGNSSPWGPASYIVFTSRQAAYCREKLGLPNEPNPLEFHMGKPLLYFQTPSAFAADEDGLWIGTEGQLKRLDFELHTNQLIQLPVNAFTPIRTICVGLSNIWIGTTGAGLIEFDKASQKSRAYIVDDGLLMNDISCLNLIGDVLWIGYGDGEYGQSGGGIGRLDISSGKFTSFIPTIANGTSDNVANEPTDKPTRRAVQAMAAGPEGDVWFITNHQPLRHYRTTGNVWEGNPRFVDGTSVALDAERLFVGGRWGRDFSGGIGVNIFNFRDKSWQAFPKVPGLPTGAVTTVTPDGDQLWVGGIGYIALLDTRQNKVRKFAYVQSPVISHIQTGGGYVWAQFNWRLYRASLGNGTF